MVRPVRPSRTLPAWAVPGWSGDDDALDAVEEVVGVSRGPDAAAMLAGYRAGVFPMPLAPGLVAWWSPQPRGVLPLDGLRVSRSLRRSMSRYAVTVDAAFDDVVAACADPTRPHRWITSRFRRVYTELHRHGAAHSLEVWDASGRLAGGLFGIAVGGLFAGESMVSLAPDASKVALVRLVEALGGPDAAAQGRLVDVQWATDHLQSLGVVRVSRREYLPRLAAAVRLPEPEGLRPGRSWSAPGPVG